MSGIKDQGSEELRTRMNRVMADMERDILHGLGSGGTSNVSTCAAETGEAFSMEKLEEAMRLVESCRAEGMTYLVSSVYEGAIVEWTPEPWWRRINGIKGRVIFMSVADSRKHHEEWPLKLLRVLSREAAYYEPVSGFPGDMAPASLLLPPFEQVKS